MYIKAKYPKVGREWYRQGVQGFGSLYGGNQISNVSRLDREDTIVNVNNSNFNQ